MALVLLGNNRPKDHNNGAELSGPRLTSIEVRDHDLDGSPRPVGDMVRDIAHVQADADHAAVVGTSLHGAWAHHSVDDAPAWVESTSPELASALAGAFGCPVGRPAGFVINHG